MKRTLIGGFFLLSGVTGLCSLWELVANNPADSWRTPPGRFLTTLLETGTLPLFLVLSALLALGLGILVLEYFRKGD